MRVAVIGTGKMGRGFAAAVAPTHEVVLGSRDPRRAARVVDATGAGRASTYAEAAVDAEIVILAVPWAAMDETLVRVGDLDGTVVVDVSNPVNEAERTALRGRSTAEVIQRRLPRARVVKAFSHVHARHLTAPVVDGIAASVLIAGDDPDAKALVSRLAADVGFHPVDVGPLRAARDLERLVGIMTFVRLGPFRVLSG